MMNQNQTGMSAFLSGLMIGGLIGAGAALLFARRSGEETRRQIGQLGEDAKTKGQEMISASRDKAEAIVADAQRHAERTAEAVKAGANDVLHAVQNPRA